MPNVNINVFEWDNMHYRGCSPTLEVLGEGWQGATSEPPHSFNCYCTKYACCGPHDFIEYFKSISDYKSTRVAIQSSQKPYAALPGPSDDAFTDDAN